MSMKTFCDMCGAEIKGHFGRLAIELDDEGKRFNSRALWVSVDYTALTHCPYCGADVVR